MKLSVIIPAYNEEGAIERIVGRLLAALSEIEYEIVIVDDASTDSTLEKLSRIKQAARCGNGKVRVFKNHINSGKGFSVRKGIQMARGDIIAIQDADMEYDPYDLPRLVAPICKGRTAVVYGSRFMRSSWPERMALPNLIANKLLTMITNILYGTRITDLCTCYKVFRADIVKRLLLHADRFTFCAEITAAFAKEKVGILEYPISYHGRNVHEGKKIKAYDFFRFIFALIVNRFDYAPRAKQYKAGGDMLLARIGAWIRSEHVHC